MLCIFSKKLNGTTYLEGVIKHFDVEIWYVSFHVDGISRQEGKYDVTNPEQWNQNHNKLSHLSASKQVLIHCKYSHDSIEI